MQDQVLVDVDQIVYGDIEGNEVFVIQSVLTRDDSPEMECIWGIVGDREPIHDFTQDDPLYLFGKARLRKWQI